MNARIRLHAPRLAGMLLGACLLTPVLSAATDGTDDRVRLRAVLSELRATGDHSHAVGQLRQLGPGGIPTVLGVLSGKLEMESDDAGPLLTPATEELFFETLGYWHADQSIAAALAWIEPDAGSRERMLVLRLLGQVGRREALHPFLDLLAGIRPEVRAHPTVSAKVEAALGEILARDARGYRILSSRLKGMDAQLLESVTRATSKVSRPEGLELLEQMLGRGVTMDAIVLRSLGNWKPVFGHCSRSEAARLAAGYLSSGEEDLRQVAAGTLGMLRDVAAVPELIERLEDGDARVRHAAHWALKEIVGGHLPADVLEWKAWLERETAWRESALPSTLGALAGEDAARAGEALRTLAHHPLFRREVLREVTLALKHSDEAVARAACSTLAILGEPCAVGALVETLHDARPTVRQAAVATLEGLTGAEHGADLAAWRTLLEG